MHLISLCKNHPDTSSSAVADALTFVEETVAADTTKKNDYKPIRTIKKRDASNMLSAITEAYSSHSYYTSGSWSRDNEIVYPDAIAPPVTGIPFDRPVRITSPFGYRQEYGRLHYGIDIAVCIGDTIRLSLPGTIRQIGTDPHGYGHYIIVEHENGLETRYAHLSQILATVGEQKQKGDPIALSGNSGRSTGPHLHFETRYKGIPLNPLNVFDFTFQE